MRYHKLFVLVFFLFSSFIISAQGDSSKTLLPEIKLSGFMDVFYAYDFGKPTTPYRLPFLYNHNRQNEFNLNLGIIELIAEHEKYRANFALQAGTYPNDNYAAEPGVLKNIFEANAGISLSKNNKLWLDAGIFGSHIGFESAISMDNWTLTRSLLAENSPYYLAGAKLSYKPNKSWEFALLACNGWQHIKRIDGNSLLSYCTQVNYNHNDKIKFNWSTFNGTDYPDSTRRMRYFNNFYSQFILTPKFGLIAGFDIGIQQKYKSSNDYDKWYCPVLIMRYAISNKWAVALRGEYFYDYHQVIIPTITPNGFMTSGSSLNIDYAPYKNVMFRVEGRWLNSADKIFTNNGNLSNDNVCVVASLAIRLEK